jgi:CheY-like chemotaxis protein
MTRVCILARLSRNISSAGMIKINPGDKSLRLLLVDDSAMTRKVCIRLMTSLGVECEEAANGEDAVAQVRASLQTATPYDGVLMDWEMPQMCGLQATRIIRDLGYTGKIFGVTGNAYKADILRFLQHGADEVFAKPLTLDKYAHIIEKIR